MDWILFVFQGGNRFYLVPAESKDDAWSQLTKRQSMSVEHCKRAYSLRGHMNANSKIWKI